MQRTLLTIILFSLIFPNVSAQSNPSDSSEKQWNFSANGYFYFVKTDKNLPSFVATADHKKLHLEGRYNYEDQNTTSIFAGWRFEFGRALQIEATPLLGTAFGNLSGIIPGFEFDMKYKRLSFYAETEYVFDFAGQESSFLYVWGELGANIFKSLTAGASYQKTRLYHTDTNITVGPYAKFSIGKFNLGAYYFNPFASDYVVVVMLGIDF